MGAVAQFLQRNGPGVFSVLVRVGDVSAAEQLAQRYGARTWFRQHRGGDGFELDEIEISVLGLPLRSCLPIGRSPVSRATRRRR
jgi:4-hydroxyphenylpyruvate dioxygenase-like putative hemolysin